MNKDDGGPAFPVGHPECTYDGQDVKESQGMSLRDYFAGLAMQAFLSNPAKANTWEASHIGQYAYGTADAMLKARKE